MPSIHSKNRFTPWRPILEKTIPSRIKRTQRDHTLGFKLQVVAAVEKGDMAYKQAQNIYGIQGRSTVLAWLRKHGKMNWTHPVQITMPNTPPHPPKKSNALNASLKMSACATCCSMKWLIFWMQNMGLACEKSIKPRSATPSARRKNKPQQSLPIIGY